MAIDRPVTKECENPDSFGEICVGCNACGRVNKETMQTDRYNMYRFRLAEEIEKFNSEFYHTNIQQTNVAKNIIYCALKLLECIEHIDFDKVDKKQVAKVRSVDFMSLAEDCKANAIDLCRICKNNQSDDCGCECDRCEKKCVCNTCVDGNKWEWRDL